MYDPYLHVFLNDSGTMLRQDLIRMVQTLRKEGDMPIFTADGKEEGTGLGYASVRRDADGAYTMWYCPHGKEELKETIFRPRVAVSKDGWQWSRHGMVFESNPEIRVDNMGIEEVGNRVGSFFQGAQALGYAYMTQGGNGIHLLRSPDGCHLEAQKEQSLPCIGDRSSFYYDRIEDEYLLISRLGRRGLPTMRWQDISVPRFANLWKSSDLLHWRDFGIILRRDDLDPPDVSIYGMQPFRYGNCWLALVEIYHQAVERLDTQLAYSTDGIVWWRMDERMPVLPRGGEGAWDSHWVVPTINAPIDDGNRIRIYYCGAGTKHGSGTRHWRSVGLATIRRDGWVSLEAGRKEGILVTTALPLDRPMRLEVNVDCRSGYLLTEVFPAVTGRGTESLSEPLFSPARLEYTDAIRQPIIWQHGEIIPPVEAGKCFLRFTLYQGSLFSYRWSPVD